jgi:hypothetical protein
MVFASLLLERMSSPPLAFCINLAAQAPSIMVFTEEAMSGYNTIMYILLYVDICHLNLKELYIYVYM